MDSNNPQADRQAEMDMAIPEFSKQAMKEKLGELYPNLPEGQLGQLVNRVMRWTTGAHEDRMADITSGGYDFGHDSELVLTNIALAQQDIGAAVVGLGIDILEDDSTKMIQWSNGYIKPAV